LVAPAVKVEAENLGVEVLQPTKVRDGALAVALRERELDMIIVAAYGRILPADILETPKYGCINVHASLLPRWRGAAPIQRAVLAGDQKAGCAIMQMDEGMDTGPVYRMRSVDVGDYETSGELWVRLAQLGGALLEEFLGQFPDVEAPTPQDGELATAAPKLEKSEGRVDWHRPVEEVVNHVRGMDPWPAATTQQGDKTLKLFSARPGSGDSPGAGIVVGVEADGLLVGCADGVVRIEEIQAPGKRRMPARAYASGNPLPSGTRLGG
jgi:methionyl-tRNA formyltransferase